MTDCRPCPAGAPSSDVGSSGGGGRESARCKKAGVRQIKIHDTRRTCGSLLAALDVHPRVAMAILRHSRIALTMEVYTQVPDKTTRDALKRLSDLLGGPQDDAEATAETDDTGPATEDDADPPRTAA